MNQGVTLCHSLIFVGLSCCVDTFRYLFARKPAKALSLYPRYRIVYEHRQPRHNKRLIAEKNADGWSSRKPPDSWSAAWKRFAPSLTAKAARYCSVSPTRENHRTRRERQTKRDIADAIRRIEPFATVEVSYTEIPDTGKSVIALSAEEQRYMRPFSYKGRAYLRVESATSIMPQEIYNQYLIQRGGKYAWEAIANPDLKISDLDEHAVISAVRGGIRSGRLPEATIREDLPTILENSVCCMTGNLTMLQQCCSVMILLLSPMPAPSGAFQRHDERRVYRQSTCHWEYLRAAGCCNGVLFQTSVTFR